MTAICPLVSYYMILTDTMKKIIDSNWFIPILLLSNFLVRLHFLLIPAHLDEPFYFLEAEHIAKNAMNPFINFSAYKPPVIYIVPVLLDKLVFPSIAWGRLTAYLFSSLALGFIYKLAELLSNHRVATLSTVLVFLFPLFMVQSLFFVDAIAFTALFLGTLYYFFSDKLLPYIICSVLLCLTKEPGILLPAMLLIYTLLSPDRNRRAAGAPRIRWFYHLIPVILFIDWLMGNKLFLGYYFTTNLTPYSRQAVLQTITTGQYIRNLITILVSNAAWPFTGIIFVSFVFLRKSLTKQMQLILIVLTAFILFHAAGDFLPRYVLFIYPLLILISVHVLKAWIKKTALLGAATVGIGVLFILTNIYTSVFASRIGLGDTSFAFMRYTQLKMQAISYISKSYSDSIIIDHTELLVPLLTYSEFGYVTHPIALASWGCPTPSSSIQVYVQCLKREGLAHLSPGPHIVFIYQSTNPTPLPDNLKPMAKFTGYNATDYIELSEYQ